MDNNNVSALTYTVFSCVIPYISDPIDRNSVSLVCRKWYQLDGTTRKHIIVPNCYSTTPSRLRKRFPFIESLTVKGQPNGIFNRRVSKTWGGYVTPWVEEIVDSFSCLKELHFKRMFVRDSDLELLAKKRGKEIKVLRLDACLGFSTDGLLYIGRCCTNLRVLCLEKCLVDDDKDGRWLHELAVRNKVIESLSFFRTRLVNYSCDDLVLVARNCGASLVCLKFKVCTYKCLADIFRYASRLEDFGGAVSINDEDVRDVAVTNFSPKMIRCITLSSGTWRHILGIRTFANQLTKLDLVLSGFYEYEHCTVLSKCPNLEELYTRDAIGDEGLTCVGQFCKKLRVIKIERLNEDDDMFITGMGLIDLAKGCLELVYLHADVIELTNDALECIGAHLKRLSDFNLVLLHSIDAVGNFPLDNGVRALLTGCTKLEKLGIHLQAAGLTDVGLGYIGTYGQNLRYLFLGLCGRSSLGGESDAGLVALSKGCPKLQKLELRGCAFSHKALATFVLNVTSLRYLWVQDYHVSKSSHDIITKVRPFWNIELITYESDDVDAHTGPMRKQPPSLLVYHSLAGQRTDFSESWRQSYNGGSVGTSPRGKILHKDRAS